MKKRIISTSLAIALGLSTIGIPAAISPVEVSANTVNQYNNQQAVEAKADELIRIAKSLIGKATYSTAEYKKTAPYKFSCATFLLYVFEKAEVDIATYNEDYMMQQGTAVSRNNLQKGDLLFFSSSGSKIPNHVAMYIGDNKVIHMADPKQHIVISDLDSKPYYKDSYITARRVLPGLLPSNPSTKGDQIVSKSYDSMNKVTMGSVNNETSLRFTGPGFVNYIYKQNGVNLGSTSATELMKKGTTVSKANLKKGDLVFFGSSKGSTKPSIVGIYAGEHRIIVPTSSGIQTRVMMVPYYKDRFITAKRVFTESTKPATVTKPAPVAKPTPVAKPAPIQTNTKANQVVNTASSLKGKAKFGYSYNEKSLTFTGAGFTYYVYKNHGIDLKYKLASQQSQVGKAVSKANLQKGDIIFFSTNNKGTRITQTGIYIGGNQFISLSTTGAVVQQSLSTTWAKANYVKARRVL